MTPRTWQIVTTDDGHAARLTREALTIPRGDRRTYVRRVAGIPAGRTVTAATVTLRRRASPSSPVVLTLPCTINDPGATGVATITFAITGTASALLRGRYSFDADVLLSDGTPYTAAAGSLTVQPTAGALVDSGGLGPTAPFPAQIVVTLAPTSLVEGAAQDTAQATAAILDQYGDPIVGSVAWSSLSLQVASVNSASGVVTRQGPGSAVIRATLVGPVQLTGETTLVVAPAGTLLADALTIDDPTATLTATTEAPKPFVQLVCDGNSLTDGVGSTPDPGGDSTGRRSSTSYPAQLAGLYLPDFPALAWTNLGVSGQTWDSMEARGTLTDAAFTSTTGHHVLFGWEVTNWLAGRIGAGTPTTAQQVIDREKAWCLARKAARPWVIGLIPTLPRVDSVLQEGSAAWQTFETLRVQSNALRLAQFHDYADFVVDLDDVLDAPGASTGPGASANYAESVHLNTPGYGRLARNCKGALDQWLSDRAGPITSVTISPAGATDAIGSGVTITRVIITPADTLDSLGGGGGGSGVVTVAVTPADTLDAVP